MELEEMQTLWTEMSSELEHQKKLTNKLIMEITTQKFRNRFNTLTLYETSGAVLCFIFSFVILLNLDKMNTWYLMACSIISLAFLTLLPIFTLRAIYRMRSMDLSGNNYKQTLITFTKKKRRLLLIQQIGVVASVFMMWITIPVFSMILNGKDFFQQEHELWLFVFVGVVTLGVLLFARWGYGAYKRITGSAEEMIKDLQDQSN